MTITFLLSNIDAICPSIYLIFVILIIVFLIYFSKNLEGGGEESVVEARAWRNALLLNGEG